MLHLSAPGPFDARYSSEIQEEWSTDFQQPFRAETGVTEPGLAEIKPHKAAAIRKGLSQLREYLQKSDPTRRSVWLITYLPQPLNKNKPTHVRIFAHKLKADELKGSGPIPTLDSLLLSRRELMPPLALPDAIPFPRLTRPDMFGLAVEPYVRRRFAGAYGRPHMGRQKLGRKGPDVLWNELAGLFRELAAETGDAYWRELSDELLAGP